MGKLLDW